MVELISVLRWIHELAAITWFGEVFVVTHTIAPTLHRLPDSPKGLVMLNLYPKVFRMATISSSTTITAGAIVALLEAMFDYYFLTIFIANEISSAIILRLLFSMKKLGPACR